MVTEYNRLRILPYDYWEPNKKMDLAIAAEVHWGEENWNYCENQLPKGLASAQESGPKMARHPLYTDPTGRFFSIQPPCPGSRVN